MDDLIRRQAVKDILFNERGVRIYTHKGEKLKHYAKIDLDDFDAIPSAKPERKTGRWIPVTNGRGGHQCDRCGCYAPSYQSGTEWLSNFCPECNADMRGEQDDNR